MEALLLIFGQIIIACLAPVLGLAGAVFAGLLELIAGILGLIFGSLFDMRRTSSRADVAGQKPQERDAAELGRPRRSRKVLHWTAGILGGTGVIALLASFVFFQPIVRHAIDVAARKAGMEVSVAGVSGTLITGNVTLQDLHVVRVDEQGLDLDLRIAQAKADVDLFSLLSREPVIQLALIEGMRGHVSPPPRRKDETAAPKTKADKRSFRADMVRIDNVDIEIRPKESAPYTMVLDDATLAPFRSRVALFDLLFRSNMTARIADQELIVQTRDIGGNGRETIWRFENVEADKLSMLVPRAPLTWLEDGRVSVSVEDRWSLSENWIDMDWTLALDGVEVRAPSEAGSAEKLLAGSLAKLVAAKQGDAVLRYRLSLDPEQVAALQSGDLRQFWDVVSSGIVKSGGPGLSFGHDPEPAAEGEGAEAKPDALSRFKNLLKRDDDTTPTE